MYQRIHAPLTHFKIKCKAYGQNACIPNLCVSGLLKDIPVVVISSEGSETRIQKLKDLGVRGFVRKPFRPEMIRDVIEEVMVKCHEG